MNADLTNQPAYQSHSDSQSFSLDGLVLGTAGLAGVWGPVNRADSVETLLLALQEGVTGLDTAPAYSNAEELLGLALREWRGKRPVISTKVGKLQSDKPDECRYDFSSKAILTSVYHSLETLQLDYLDILFLHDPAGIESAEINQVMTTLGRLRDEGVVRVLGIGGNYPPSFQPFIRSDIFQVFMGYNRFNAVCREALSQEYPLLRAEGLKIWQASPLFMGLLGSRFETYQRAAPEWIPPKYVQAAAHLQHYGQAYGLSLSELALRYLRSTAVIDKIVIGAANRDELLSSLQAWRKGSLPQTLFETINRLGVHD